MGHSCLAYLQEESPGTGKVTERPEAGVNRVLVAGATGSGLCCYLQSAVLILPLAEVALKMFLLR